MELFIIIRILEK